MRALLISNGGRVEAVEVTDDIESYYEHIKCQVMTSAGYLDDRHVAYVDDEGLLTLKEGDYMYLVDWYPERLAGNILVTGLDHNTGETLDATLGVPELWSRIKAIYRVYNLPPDDQN